ncbi:MAG: DNA repair protein RecO [Alphaproteobacteria bacterium]|jgi:DNA repair protein RecO (recombination protein O)
MEWTDEGIVLAARPHGEGAAIVSLLTRSQGRHAGLVHGGAGRSKRATVEVGNRVQATWRARLAEHLGTLTLEATHFHAAAMLDDPLRLAAMTAACAVADGALPEREPHPVLFEATCALLSLLEGADNDVWPAAYIRWELGVLAELGFGLDLGHCAATGSTDDLLWVSPRTGHAVSRAAGMPYSDRLLALPVFLGGRPSAEEQADRPGDIASGLALTGHFLAAQVFAPFNRPPPAARDRLVSLLLRQSAGEAASDTKESIPND